MRVRRFGLRVVPMAIIVGAVAVVGGCGTGGSARMATTSSPSSPPSSSSSSSSSSSNVAAPQQVLPPCTSVSIEYRPKLQDQHIRCTLRIDNSLGLDVSSDPAWSFTLRNAGAVAQEFRESTDQVGETGNAPLLQDIDDNGTPELLVITGRGGTGGEPMAVWRLTGRPSQFVRAGEIFGFRRFYQTPEGFFGNYAHSSAASGVVQLYRWVEDKLVGVALLDMQVADAPPEPGHQWVRNEHVLCRLSTDDYPPGAEAKRTIALRDAGIDPTTAGQRFCGQPWVASIYK